MDFMAAGAARQPGCRPGRDPARDAQPRVLAGPGVCRRHAGRCARAACSARARCWPDSGERPRAAAARPADPPGTDRRSWLQAEPDQPLAEVFAAVEAGDRVRARARCPRALPRDSCSKHLRAARRRARRAPSAWYSGWSKMMKPCTRARLTEQMALDARPVAAVVPSSPPRRCRRSTIARASRRSGASSPRR